MIFIRGQLGATPDFCTLVCRQCKARKTSTKCAECAVGRATRKRDAKRKRNWIAKELRNDLSPKRSGPMMFRPSPPAPRIPAYELPRPPRPPFNWQRWYENGGRAKILAARKRSPRRKEWAQRGKALRRGAKRGYWVTKRDIERLWNRQERRCAYCPAPITLETAQQDHVIPVVRGGVHSIGNIVLACGPCNASKGAKIPIKWYTQRRYSPVLVERGRVLAEHARAV